MRIEPERQIIAAEFPNLVNDRLEDSRDTDRLVDARAYVADAELQRRVFSVGAYVPPDFGAVWDGFGAHEQVAVALEVVCSFDEGRRLYYYNQALGILPTIWNGQLWRPFTTTLLHANLLHAAFNVMVFLSFGPVLEARFGPFRFLGLVVLFGYLTMLPQFIISTADGELTMIVGLSGIIYGLFGILLVGRRHHTDMALVCDPGTVQTLLFWLVLCVVLTHLGLLPVANTAHIAGLGFGVLLGLAFFEPRRKILWRVLAVVASLAVLTTLVACPGHPWYERVKHPEQQLQRLLEQFEQQPPEKPLDQ
jgi:membrane associated rhomboid family serine protease